MVLERSRRSDERSVPTGLESPTSKLVYTYCRANGPCSLEELARDLDIPRLTLYPVLETLTAADHLRSEDRRYTTAG